MFDGRRNEFEHQQVTVITIHIHPSCNKKACSGAAKHQINLKLCSTEKCEQRKIQTTHKVMVTRLGIHLSPFIDSNEFNVG